MKGNGKHVAPSRDRSITWQTTWHIQNIYASIDSRFPKYLIRALIECIRLPFRWNAKSVRLKSNSKCVAFHKIQVRKLDLSENRDENFCTNWTGIWKKVEGSRISSIWFGSCFHQFGNTNAISHIMWWCHIHLVRNFSNNVTTLAFSFYDNPSIRPIGPK